MDATRNANEPALRKAPANVSYSCTYSGYTWTYSYGYPRWMKSKGLSRTEIVGMTKAARASGEDLVERIERLKGGVAQAFHEMGRCLAELLERKLHAALGYDSFDALLEARGLMSTMQAYKLIEVSKHFSKVDAARLGPEKAYALVRHVARTKQEDDPAEYLLEGFPIGGRRRPIDQVTARDIREATRTAVSRHKGELGESERARRDAESMQRKVRAAMVKRTKGDAEVRLVFRRGAWRLQVDFPVAMGGSALRLD